VPVVAVLILLPLLAQLTCVCMYRPRFLRHLSEA
jgi:hypothetical protein